MSPAVTRGDASPRAAPQQAQLARALVAERAAQKPASWLNRRLQERLRMLPSAA